MLMKMIPPPLSNYGITVSSNFTEPGLRRNVELNLLTTEQHQLAALHYYTPRTVVPFVCREALNGNLGIHQKLVDEHSAPTISVVEAKQSLAKLLNA